MPNVMTPEGKTKEFEYSEAGKKAATSYKNQNPGSKMKNVLANREMKKGKGNGYS
jgi:hypothetical protein|tara:strand:+ start:106 stop:270 length:165 start_codon:yes stop_codon:yes gene_type:complete